MFCGRRVCSLVCLWCNLFLCELGWILLQFFLTGLVVSGVSRMFCMNRIQSLRPICRVDGSTMDENICQLQTSEWACAIGLGCVENEWRKECGVISYLFWNRQGRTWCIFVNAGLIFCLGDMCEDWCMRLMRQYLHSDGLVRVFGQCPLAPTIDDSDHSIVYHSCLTPI